MALLIDIGGLSPLHTDETLEFLHKAISHSDGDAIWDAHPDASVRQLIELFTQRGLLRLDEVNKEVVAWSQGARKAPGIRPPRPAGAMERWGSDELKLVRIYLERLPPAQWTLDDHMMMVDYVVQRYLPSDELKSEADWLATRSTLMGRVQANMANLEAKQIEKVAIALPLTVPEALERFQMTSAQRQTIEYAAAHAGENVRQFREDTRHVLRTIVVRRAQERALGTEQGSLQTELVDRFATLNRDWRRIAITESGTALNEGLIASLPVGSQVKRVEQYRGACPFCRSIDGKIVTIVSPDKKDKDGDKEIWSGKSNLNRSASPRKRVGDELVPRTEDERWWLPASLAHPNCRGRWVPVIQMKPDDDPDFHKWLVQTLNPKT
jgi:hypothetical protein